MIPSVLVPSVELSLSVSEWSGAPNGSGKISVGSGVAPGPDGCGNTSDSGRRFSGSGIPVAVYGGKNGFRFVFVTLSRVWNGRC